MASRIEVAPDEEVTSPEAVSDGRSGRSSSGGNSLHSEEPHGSYNSDDEGQPQWDAGTRVEAEFDYHHADGRYSRTVIKGRRSDGSKTFKTARRFQGSLSDLDLARREEPHSFYRWPDLKLYQRGAGDEDPLLYRLPELIADIEERPDDSVFICEGEKDTDTLRAHDLIATSSPNGAGKFLRRFAKYFGDCNVVILPDNDDRGRQHAQHIASVLSSKARSIRIIHLPNLPEKEDVTFWLDKGHTAADLLGLVRGAKEWVAGENDAEAGGRGSRTPPGEFTLNENGVPFRTLRNARVALAQMGVTLSYDEFAGRFLIAGLPGFGPQLDDAALTRMRLQMEERWGLIFGKDRWFDIATDEARQNTFHPVRDYLASLKWDGKSRLDTWLHEYAKAEDNEYVRAVGAIALIAAVRRVREPGCKFDEMIVLESQQGTDKSSALALLAGPDEWFTDDCPLNADSKVMIEQIGGRWIVEMGELKGMRRGDVEHVKSTLSRRVDKARLAYGRMPVEQPRQCVFFGTTNDTAYLRDMTGNRRFWPVRVDRFDLKALRRDRDQIWAEAAQREAKGESIRLPENLWAVAGVHQAAREIGDPIYDTLAERLDGLEGKVRASDIWEAIGLGEVGKRTQDHNVRVSAAMQRLGWRRPKSKLRFDGKAQGAWIKGPEGEQVSAFEEVPRAVVLGSGENDRRAF